MITKIEQIDDVGIFDGFQWDVSVPEFGKVNLIYGYNGCGKTTLSNLFRLYSKICPNKEELFKNICTHKNVPLIKIQMGGRSLKINNRNLSDYDEDIYVFNTDFVANHVYSGQTANIRKFSSDVKLVDDRINKIENRISSISVRKEIINEEISQISSSLNKIWDKYKEKFRQHIKGRNLTDTPTIYDSPPSDSLTELTDQLEGKLEDYRLSQEQERLKEDIDTLESIKLKEIEINFSEIKTLLNRNILRESESFIEEKIDVLKKNLKDNIDEEQGIIKWYELGHQILVDRKEHNDLECPLCQSDLSNKFDLLLEEYSTFFSTQFKEFSKSIENNTTYLKTSFDLLDSNNSGLLNAVTVLKNYEYDKIKGIEIIDISEYKSVIDQILVLLSNKLESPDKQIKLPQSLIDEIDLYNEKIRTEKEKLSDNIQIFKEKEYDEEEIVRNVKSIIKKLALAEHNKLKRRNRFPFELSKDLKKLDEKIDLELSQLSSKKMRAVAELKKESSFVNEYLKKLGVYHFEIDIREKENDNLSVIYTDENITKNSIKNSLSEGEKTALALSYYFSKIRFEVKDNIDKNIEN
ncbi:MAG TPA: AAA family ATPase, partial [Bacteroidales bacterium]|nr:AAA family ATPase [Bacteroidales bacterium]